jgi:hypothetical protein
MQKQSSFLLKSLPRVFPHSPRSRAEIESLWPLSFVMQSQRKLSFGQKDYGDISLLTCSSPTTSKGRTKASEAHRTLVISMGFAPLLKRMPYRYPPLRAAVVG